ncbi:MAG: hypothetical protein EOP32_03405 [Rhodococcus sp. (in: high G+C Gram-positive bacteria)]|nr:MAG: hypothetical protein EOP32_03405 [Rhodococcus sp. (in: high G+C Gram-positive bacteria)]
MRFVDAHDFPSQSRSTRTGYGVVTCYDWRARTTLPIGGDGPLARVRRRPGDRIDAHPVNAAGHRVVVPSRTFKIEVLPLPVDPGQYTALRFTQRLVDAGSGGDNFDNALVENR